SRRRHTRLVSDWSSDVCSSDLKTTKTPTGRCRSSYTWRRRPSACRERHRRPLSIHPKARAESAYKLESCFKPGGNPTIQRNFELLKPDERYGGVQLWEIERLSRRRGPTSKGM